MPFVMFWNYRVYIMISALAEMWHCHVIFQESARFYLHRTHCWFPVIKVTCHSVILVMHLKPTYVITRTRPLLKMLVKHSIDATIYVGVLSTHIFRNTGMMFEVWLNNTNLKHPWRYRFFLFLLVSRFLRCYNFASLADHVPYSDHVFHVTHKAHFFTKREQLNIYHRWLMIFEQAVLLVILRNHHPLHVNVLFAT